jgi:hypothetical protein
MSNKIHTINIAKDFSKFPAGRYVTDGEFSGQRFREKLLHPQLKRHKNLIVELDGTAGYGSSFLDEAFGGLVRHNGYSSKELHDRLRIKAFDNSLLLEIWEYIESAQPQVAP